MGWRQLALEEHAWRRGQRQRSQRYRWNEIVTMIAPGPRDIVIKKQKPSGFFGTNLASYLTLLGCDSVILVGTTTSGCVRATVVDAFSLNYRVILAEEGCFDRSEASHAVSLCDKHAKYADVLPTAEILSYFEQLPTDLFDLPTGGRSPATPVREAAEESISGFTRLPVSTGNRLSLIEWA
ncbi:MAG: isochorismatase family protein [Stellaceae bacterium]